MLQGLIRLHVKEVKKNVIYLVTNANRNVVFFFVTIV